MSKKKVLHLAKWYPNKVEPLLGIFILILKKITLIYLTTL